MDIYEELGVRILINASGPETKVGGSLMPPDVLEAMAEAAKAFVDMDELLEKAGERIAQLTRTPAAFVTSGAAAGLAVTTAACMAGADPVKAKQLPDTTGMKNEVVMLRTHRIHYDQAVRMTGARIVEGGFADWSSIEDVEPFVRENTAAILYVAKAENASGSVPLRQVIELGKRKEVPVIVDGADELPPASNLHRFTDMGADLVLFSGGKDLCGPQASGLVLGRRDLIRACAVNGSPNYGIGRPMKVAKEIVVGLVKAVELYVRQDFEIEMRVWKNQRDYVVENLSGLPCVTTGPVQYIAPGSPGSFYLPAAYVNLDEVKLGITMGEVVQKLRGGNPRISVGQSPTGIIIRAHMLKEGDENTVVARLREIIESRRD